MLRKITNFISQRHYDAIHDYIQIPSLKFLWVKVLGNRKLSG